MTVNRIIRPVNYIGESTDTKPILGVSNGSTFYETDTRNIYFFNDYSWGDVIVEPPVEPPVDNAFTMIIDTTKAGSASNTFILPLPSTGTYNYDVDWGDGNVETSITANTSKTHVYASSGVYTVKISGIFPRIYFSSALDALKLMDVINWGHIVWSSMNNAFKGCANAKFTATDTLLLPADSAIMFSGCTTFNQSVSNFNTANVTNMGYMFQDCTAFNQSVSNFDTAKVTSMISMFNNASNFNQDVSNFNTHLVTNMNYMFLGNTKFNRDISSFNITALTTATSMLQASAFSNTNYDLLLLAWAAQVEKPNVPFHAGTAKYSAGAPKTARDSLVASGWTITDGGQLP